MDDNPLALVPLTDLVAEVERRCAAGVLALSYRDEGYVGADEFTTHTRLWGDFVVVSGLAAYVGTRAECIRYQKHAEGIEAQEEMDGLDHE